MFPNVHSFHKLIAEQVNHLHLAFLLHVVCKHVQSEWRVEPGCLITMFVEFK